MLNVTPCTEKESVNTLQTTPFYAPSEAWKDFLHIGIDLLVISMRTISLSRDSGRFHCNKWMLLIITDALTK